MSNTKMIRVAGMEIFLYLAGAILGGFIGSQTGAMTVAAMEKKYGAAWIDRRWWQFEWF